MIRYSLAIDIPDDILDKRVKKANSWLQEEIIDDTDQFVPMRTGALAGTVYRNRICNALCQIYVLRESDGRPKDWSRWIPCKEPENRRFGMEIQKRYQEEAH